MSVLDKLKSTVSFDPPVILFYGVDGIGKTSLAAEFPHAIYLSTPGEKPPKGVDLPGRKIKDYVDLMEFLKALRDEKHDFCWVIIDSVDGLEPLIWDETNWRCDKKSIEDHGFGKGYVEADREWNDFLDVLADLQALGVGVVMIAHPEIVRFDSPLSEPYNTYTIKLHKRANALVREKVDIVGFMNYRVKIKKEEIARQKTVTHAEGDERTIYLNGNPSYNAKNRYGMPDAIPYKQGKGYEALAKYFPAAPGVP